MASLPPVPEPGRSPGDLPEFLEASLVAAAELRDDDQDEVVQDLCCRHPAWAAHLWRTLATLRRRSLLTDGAPPPKQEDRTRLGPYRMLGRLGQGGAGTVFVAEHVALGHRVALKTIRGEYLDHELVRRRFRREMLALTKLEHPHICRVHEVGEDRGVPFMALQLIDGEDLGRRIAAARAAGTNRPDCVQLPVPIDLDLRRLPTALPVAVAAIVFLFAKVARAAHTAHLAGLVHRDLKPGNIMVTPSGEPVVLDFGLARAADARETRLSESGDLLGTVEYMAPEQALGGSSDVDHRADVYALGVSLFEALCLELPFHGRTRHEILDAVRGASAPRSLRRLNRSLPRALTKVVAKAMTRERSRRYSSAEELAANLEGILESRSRKERRGTRWQSVRYAILASAVMLSIVASAIPTAATSDRVRFTARAKQAGPRVILSGVYTADSPDFTSYEADDAGATTEAGDQEAAADLLVATLRKESDGPIRMAKALRQRGRVAESRSQAQVAESHYRDARNLLEIYLPANDPLLLSARYDVLHVQESTEEAVWRTFLVHAEGTLGSADPTVRAAKHDLALLMLDRGRRREHVRLLDEALVIHPTPAGPWPAAMLDRNGHLDAAAVDLQLRGTFAAAPTGSSRDLESAATLAAAALHLARHADAAQVAIRALPGELLRPIAGASPSHLQIARSWVAALAAEHRLVEAADLIARIDAFLVQPWTAAGPSRDSELAGALASLDLGMILVRLGRHPEAERRLLAAFEVLRQDTDPRHAAMCRCALHVLYRETNQPTKAIAWRQP